MKKQGFTLIELMVVIVIMGILAAVAVPKLFGMIAKSKASEVGPAAGTYVKLQQAYISESVAIGNWQIIGYKGPGTEDSQGTATGGAKSHTTNFEYTDAADGYTGNTVALSSGKIGWSAKNLAQLNDCPVDVNWTVNTTAASGSAGEATFTAAIKQANLATCTALTPNFDKIGK